MGEQRFYSEQEAEKLLKLASTRNTNQVSRDELLRAASEIGISSDDFANAEQELAKLQEKEHNEALLNEEKLAFDQIRRHKLMGHVYSFLGGNAVLIGIWAMSGIRHGTFPHNNFWPMWVLGFWAIGLISDVLDHLNPANRDKAFRKYMKGQEARRAASQAGLTDIDVIAETMYESEGMVSKLKLIREYRHETNTSLAHAKELADDYCQRHPGRCY